MPYAFERANYRIPYPPAARPRFYMEGTEFEVLDCSEGGVRFLCPPELDLPEPGTQVTGSIRLLHGAQKHEVKGTVLRWLGRQVSVQFEKPGIPLQAIFSEQRYMARRFPARAR